jgi:tetratricopeptide (TPR) repeat protein
MTCPDDSQLAAFLDELLSGNSSAAIAAHIDECRHCQTRLDEIVTCDVPGGLDIQSSIPMSAADSHDHTAIADLVQRLQSGAHPLSEVPERPTQQRRFVSAGIRETDLPVTLDHYSLVEKIGEGATGELYRAIDERLRRDVAVKLLKPELAAIPTARARFEREARACAALKHDHIVAVHHVEASDSERSPYLVMDYVRGGSLYDQFEKSRGSELRASVEWLRQAAIALQAAHKSGIIHRDVKPSNLLIDESTGRLLVADFGLARLIESEESLTAADAIAGTPAYMSPEQIAHPREITGQTDVYSLGVVLYEVITGERPFRGIVRMVLNQVLHEEPASPRRLNDRIPRDLETICLKAMSKEPRLRYRSAAAFADDLQQWLDGKPVAARPVGPAGRLWRWARRNPGLAGVSTIVAAVLIAGAIDWGQYRRMSVSGQLRRDWQKDVTQRDELISRNIALKRQAEQRWLQSIRLLSLTISERKHDSDAAAPPLSNETRTALESLTTTLHHEELTESTMVGAQILGDIWSQLGDDNFAFDSYQAAESGARELLIDDPHNMNAIRVLFQSERRLGEIDLEAGRIDDADRRLKAALDTCQKSIDVSSDVTTTILRRLAESSELRSDFPSAIAYYEEALQQLASIDDSATNANSFMVDASVVALRLAVLLNRLDDPRAHDICLTACELCQRTSQQGIEDYRRLAAAHGELAACLNRVGRSDEEVTAGLTQHAKTLASIAAHSDASTVDIRKSGVAWLQLATRHARSDQWARSFAAAESSVQLLASIVATSERQPTDALNFAEAELLAISIQMKDGVETSVERLRQVELRLQNLKVAEAEGDAEVLSRTSSLLQKCGRLIEAASAAN